MSEGPNVRGNPLKISVSILVASYLIGEFIFPKYNLLYLFHLIGILGLIISIFIFISGFSLFKSYSEDPTPSSLTNRLIKTGIFAYIRNPIYFSFILFFFSMFLIFENVMYFLSSLGLVFWIHNWVIKAEEEYLKENFTEEYERYSKAVKRWLFF